MADYIQALKEGREKLLEDVARIDQALALLNGEEPAIHVREHVKRVGDKEITVRPHPKRRAKPKPKKHQASEVTRATVLGYVRSVGGKLTSKEVSEGLEGVSHGLASKALADLVVSGEVVQDGQVPNVRGRIPLYRAAENGQGAPWGVPEAMQA